MNEKRIIVKDWKETEKIALADKYKLVAKYKFTDHVYIGSKKRIVRIRHYHKPLDVEYHKANAIITAFDGKNQKCNNLKEAKQFVEEKYPNFHETLHYTRTGRRYKKDQKTQIFIERLKGYFDTVEIESWDQRELEHVVKIMKPAKTINERLPEYLLKLKPKA